MKVKLLILCCTVFITAMQFGCSQETPEQVVQNLFNAYQKQSDEYAIFPYVTKDAQLFLNKALEVMSADERQNAMKNWNNLLTQLSLQYSPAEYSGDTACVLVTFQKGGKNIIALPMILLRENGDWKVSTYSICSPDTALVFLKLQAVLDPQSQAANLLNMMESAGTAAPEASAASSETSQSSIQVPVLPK